MLLGVGLAVVIGRCRRRDGQLEVLRSRAVDGRIDGKITNRLMVDREVVLVVGLERLGARQFSFAEAVFRLGRKSCVVPPSLPATMARAYPANRNSTTL